VTSPFEPPRFGTDGLRGRAGDPPLDPETLRRVGAALGLWLQRSGPERKRVVAAHDGRESATWILEALAEGLSATDTACTDVGLVATPGLAWIVRNGPYVAGVMISASHNPASDNGIKIFTSEGRKLSDEDERTIERLTLEIDPPRGSGPRVQADDRAVAGYEEMLVERFSGLGLDLSGATVVFDGANGAASSTGPLVLEHFGADVVTIGCEPDGFNINDGVGALHPDRAAELVRQSGAILGVCLDGDADRCILVDERGRVRDGDDVLATLGPWLRDRGELPGDTVVGTVMSNLGLRRELAAKGIRLEQTPVGDRHVAARMREGGFALGGEPSGHVLFRPDRSAPDHLVGDGLWTALTILSLPGIRKHGASASMASFEHFPQLLLNVPVREKPPLEEVEAIERARRAVVDELGDDGRVVLRYSGTESLCRVMVEAPDEDRVRRHAEAIAAAVRDTLGA
jgi:phosphoglucosamine mutase